MYLGTLIKKDIRHQSRFILAAAIFLILPYLTALISLIKNHMGGYPQVEWIRLFSAASIADVFICVLLIAFFAGNSIAGERADRSSEFLAYLPIGRKTAILSKALVALGISIVFFGVCALIAYVLLYFVDNSHYFRPVRGAGPGGVGLSSCILIFGIAWLVSTFVASPTYAAAAGIIIPISLGIVLAILMDPVEQYHMQEMWETAHTTICLVIGPLCFIAGVIYYSKRVEP